MMTPVAARPTRTSYWAGFLGIVGLALPSTPPHDLLRSLRWTPVGVGPQLGYTRRLGKQ